MKLHRVTIDRSGQYAKRTTGAQVYVQRRTGAKQHSCTAQTTTRIYNGEFIRSRYYGSLITSNRCASSSGKYDV